LRTSPVSRRRRRTIGSQTRWPAQNEKLSSGLTAGFSPTLCANRRRDPGREQFCGRAHSETVAHTFNFVRCQGAARRRRRDDYRQPQSSHLQWLQTQVVLRRFQRFRNVPDRRKFSRPQSGQTVPLAEAVKAGWIKIADVRPAIMPRSKNWWISSSSRNQSSDLPMTRCLASARVVSSNCSRAPPAGSPP